jgi:ComF family protein
MMRFFDFLFPPREDELVVRTLTPDSLLAHLSPQLVPLTRPETTALLPFSNPLVRAALHEAKYHGSARAFDALAAVLHEYLKDIDLFGATPIIVPIPLGKQRRESRGFNQVTEVLTRALPGTSCELSEGLLVRVHETASQISLPRAARAENMRGAFAVEKTIDPDRTYIVVDDVTTTGATLQAALDAVSKAGARHVIALALAH